MTVWGGWIITVWNTDDWQQLGEVKMPDYFPVSDVTASHRASVCLSSVESFFARRIL